MFPQTLRIAIDMPLTHLALLAFAAIALPVLSQWLRWHAFVAILAVSVLFGVGASMSISLIGKAFGAGFAGTVESAGLIVIAAAFVLALAEDCGVAAHVTARIGGWQQRRSAPILAVIGLLGGLAATPVAALAVLTPMFCCLGGTSRRWSSRGALILAFAISAGAGLLPPAPAPMAAAAILGADTLLLALVGLPAAVIAVLAGKLFLYGFRFLLPDGEEMPAGTAEGAPGTALRAFIALIIASIAMLVLLIVQLLGEIASEPFGIGPTRELLLGLGRPAVLLVVGIGLAALVTGRWSALLSAQGLAGRALAGSASIVFVLGAAGGFQSLTQETGMAALLAEPLLDWRIGLVMPFAVAAVIKTAQGSSLVAAITAAGMVQPLLLALGLDAPTGRALAAAAIGLGAMTASHVNDPFFWLTAHVARIGPGRGLVLFALGTLVQGIAGLAVLLALAWLLPS